MSTKTGIEWTEATWNPVTGCTKVSQGCKHCYAERDWARLSAPRTPPNIYTGRAFTDVRCHPERLDQPLRWTKPRRIFVNSMSDLFHEDVPDDFIDRVFAVMALTPSHTYQVLTKRPERMLNYMTEGDGFGRWGFIDGRARQILRAFNGREIPTGKILLGPLPHVWLGVSVEDQETADARIPLLLQTPAAVRFLSCEPLLGPVDLNHMWSKQVQRAAIGQYIPGMYNKLNWVIVGGESGPKARPFSVDAADAIVRQCAAANVPCFVKQIGRYPYSEIDRWSIRGGGVVVTVGDAWTFRDELRDRKGGDPTEWPEYLRVREYPA